MTGSCCGFTGASTDRPLLFQATGKQNILCDWWPEAGSLPLLPRPLWLPLANGALGRVGTVPAMPLGTVFHCIPPPVIVLGHVLLGLRVDTAPAVHLAQITIWGKQVQAPLPEMQQLKLGPGWSALRTPHSLPRQWLHPSLPPSPRLYPGMPAPPSRARMRVQRDGTHRPLRRGSGPIMHSIQKIKMKLGLILAMSHMGNPSPPPNATEVKIKDEAEVNTSNATENGRCNEAEHAPRF